MISEREEKEIDEMAWRNFRENTGIKCSNCGLNLKVDRYNNIIGCGCL